MSIIGIVAIARDRAIGRDGKLPWHYSPDLKFFKRTTVGHAVVMGYNTWASIGRPLPKRLNIVLSRTRDIEHAPRVLLMRGREEVLALKEFLDCDLFIIGGAETYRTFAADIDKWIVTEIPESIPDADARMPKDFLEGFVEKETHELAEGLRVRVLRRPV